MLPLFVGTERAPPDETPLVSDMLETTQQSVILLSSTAAIEIANCEMGRECVFLFELANCSVHVSKSQHEAMVKGFRSRGL